MFTPLAKASPWVPVVLLILLIVGWSELDLYAPAFPQMMHHFGTNAQVMQWTLSLNFFGFFCSSLLCGSLSDSYGRRPLLIAGSLLFVLGSGLCMFAPNISSILLGRFIQGVGVGAPLTIALAVIGDIYQGEKQARLLSVMNTTVTIVMAAAPIAGVYLTDEFGWRSTFVVTGLGALFGAVMVALLLPETHYNREPFRMRQMAANYFSLLGNRLFMAATLSMSFLAACYFMFIGMAPLLFMEALGVPLKQYAFYQGSVVGAFAAVSLAIPTLMNHFNVNQMLRVSLWLSLLASVVLFAIGVSHLDHPLIITIFMSFFTAGIALPGCVLFAATMDMFPGMRASSAALFQAMRLLTMSIVTSIMGAMYNGTFLPAAVMIFVLTIPAFFMGLFVVKTREKNPTSNETFQVGAGH